MEKHKKTILARLTVPIILLVFFWAIAILFWQLKNEAVHFFNFAYIGTAIALGAAAYDLLPRRKKPSGRRFTQLLVGIYMLGYLGFYRWENMQIEGFFFSLLGGYFGGAVIHYLVAKVVNPVIIGRGWCGWACWTAMVLDFLPYKTNRAGRIASQWEKLRYAHFILSLSLVLILWFVVDYRPVGSSVSALKWLAAGNAWFFGSGIALAIILKDNRAFCKYVCPIAPLLKASSRLALFKIEGKPENCTDCKACAQACPMDIDIPAYVKQGSRVLSTECIICQTCTAVCPRNNLSMTCKWDHGTEEKLRRKKQDTGTTPENGNNTVIQA